MNELGNFDQKEVIAVLPIFEELLEDFAAYSSQHGAIALLCPDKNAESWKVFMRDVEKYVVKADRRLRCLFVDNPFIRTYVECTIIDKIAEIGPSRTVTVVQLDPKRWKHRTFSPERIVILERMKRAARKQKDFATLGPDPHSLRAKTSKKMRSWRRSLRRGQSKFGRLLSELKVNQLPT